MKYEPKWYILDKENKPVLSTSEGWYKWISDNNGFPIRIDYTQVSDKVYVSTIFLGLNHNFGEGPPILFETMIFGFDDGIEYQWRYSSFDDAMVGHDMAVKKAMNLLGSSTETQVNTVLSRAVINPYRQS